MRHSNVRRSPSCRVTDSCVQIYRRTRSGEPDGRFRSKIKVSNASPSILVESVLIDDRDSGRRIIEAVKSRPVDLSEVAARLQKPPPHRETAPLRSPSPPLSLSSRVTLPDPTEEEQYQGRGSQESTPPLPTEEEQYQLDLRTEIDAYNALVTDGGQPLYPLSLLEDVSKSPEKYRELLSPVTMQFHRPNRWTVFIYQFLRWRDFRCLQRYARGQSQDDYWESVRQESFKAKRFGGNEPRVLGKGWDEIPSWWVKKDDRIVRVSGDYRNWEDFLGRHGRTTEQAGFHEYAEALKERLINNGFTRTFRLEEDLTHQDKLTTWIEYIGYEYWWYDQHARYKRWQPWYEKAWKELSKVLRPSETEEFIHNIDCALQHASEEERAEKAVKSAESDVIQFETAIRARQRSNRPAQELRERLLEAKSKLEAAIKEHDSIKRRNDLITNFIQRTRNYRTAKHDAEHHSILLQWMLQQIPLIEGELNSQNVAEKKSNRVDGGRLKRGRADGLGEGGPMAQSYNDAENNQTSRSKTHMVSASVGDETYKHSSHGLVGDSRPRKRLRHNDQGLGVFDGRISTSANTTVPTGGSQDVTDVANSVGVELAMDKKAPPAKKRERGIKTCDPSGSRPSLPSKKAQSDVSLSSVAKHPRRSARIAAIAERQQRLRATMASPSNDVKTRHTRVLKRTQMLTPPSSSPESLVQEARFPARAATKRGRSNRSYREY